MKKILIIGLALIMCMGMVFAVPSYTLQLVTEVADGSDGNGTGTDDGNDFQFGGIKGWIFYSGDSNLSIGTTSESGLSPVTGLLNAEDNSTTKGELTADLDGQTAGADQVYLYIMTSSNCSTADNGGTVTFSSSGWKYKGTIEEGNPDNIALTFTSTPTPTSGSESTAYGVTVSTADNNASEGTESSAKFTYSASAGSNTAGVKSITGKSIVTWPQDKNPLAGEWQADIKIEVNSN